MKAIFMGSPDFAIPALEALAREHTLVGVVTTPDKPRSRMQMTPTPVAVKAGELGVPVYKPQTLKDGALAPVLEELAPDVIVVVAYGKILPQYVLDFGRYGCVNVHGSLLPRYRGAAPMQRAIMDGVAEIGVTTMQMDAGLDTGDMLLQAALPLDPEADFEWVHDNLATLGADLLIQTLAGLEDGSIVPQKQDDSLSTYAAKITKEECLVDFAQPAVYLHNKIRALSPFPLAFSFLNGKLIKIIKTKPTDLLTPAAPGTVVDCSDSGVTVACGNGALVITDLLPEGKRRMPAADFVRGRGVKPGDAFSAEK